LNSGPSPWATPPALFCEGFFWDKVPRTICLDWLQTTILLISASIVAGLQVWTMGTQLLSHFYFHLAVLQFELWSFARQGLYHLSHSSSPFLL
jgi:hypothetical protein